MTDKGAALSYESFARLIDGDFFGGWIVEPREHRRHQIAQLGSGFTNHRQLRASCRCRRNRGRD